MEGLCPKCNKTSKGQVNRRAMVDVELVTMKNGRRAAKGKCEVCGSGMFKIVKKDFQL